MRRLVLPFQELLASRVAPRSATGAFCRTCRRPTDSELIIEQHRGARNGLRYLVKCHGAEETCYFEFGSQEWDSSDVQRAVTRYEWFDPFDRAGNVIAKDGV